MTLFRGQILGIQKERPCRVLNNQQLTRFFCASGGTHGSSRAFNRYREIDLGMKQDLVKILENKK